MFSILRNKTLAEAEALRALLARLSTQEPRSADNLRTTSLNAIKGFAGASVVTFYERAPVGVRIVESPQRATPRADQALLQRVAEALELGDAREAKLVVISGSSHRCRVVAYVPGSAADTHSFSRLELDPVPFGVFERPSDSGWTEVFLRPWRPRHERYLGAASATTLLRLRFESEVVPTQLHAAWLLALARNLGFSIWSSRRISRQKSLIAWASAGVGPIHQLVGVAQACQRELVEARSNRARERSNVAVALDLSTVIEEQLWLLHQFANRVEPLLHGPSSPSELLEGIVEKAVYHAELLVGADHDAQIDFEQGARGARVYVSDVTPINAALSCAISNSLKYGIPKTCSVRTSCTNKEVAIVVSNEAYLKDDLVKHLADAKSIANHASHGDLMDVFEGLASEGSDRGFRGIGTWLAARVARELLGGHYAIEHEVMSPHRLRIHATLSFSRADGTSTA
ncbi:MAG: hypothetical protein AAF581_02050 [Planctomycetota bacterium]